MKAFYATAFSPAYRGVAALVVGESALDAANTYLATYWHRPGMTAPSAHRLLRDYSSLVLDLAPGAFVYVQDPAGQADLWLRFAVRVRQAENGKLRLVAEVTA